VKRRWGIVGDAALALAGVALAVVIAEVLLRVLLPKPNFYIYDSHTGWKPNPGAAGWDHEENTAWVAINREGFRGPPQPYDKPPCTVRIAVMGDSFTEAQQVPMGDTFCAVMQRELENCPAFKGRKVEVMDFGATIRITWCSPFLPAMMCAIIPSDSRATSAVHFSFIAPGCFNWVDRSTARGCFGSNVCSVSNPAISG
jgi:hypothetical protein